MTTFRKSYVSFYLKQNTYFSAYAVAMQKQAPSHLMNQLTNIRTSPLNLQKNLIISNILENKKRSTVKLNSIYATNFLALYMLLNLHKKKYLAFFLRDFFYFAKESLDKISSEILTQKISKLSSQKKNISINRFFIEKLGQLSFYTYTNILLNKSARIQLPINNLILTNFWGNISESPVVQEHASETKKNGVSFIFQS